MGRMQGERCGKSFEAPPDGLRAFRMWIVENAAPALKETLR